jgi:hypothetical protein
MPNKVNKGREGPVALPQVEPQGSGHDGGVSYRHRRHIEGRTTNQRDDDGRAAAVARHSSTTATIRSKYIVVIRIVY